MAAALVDYSKYIIDILWPGFHKQPLIHDKQTAIAYQVTSYPYELAEWKSATVQFNYHISVNGILSSVPCEFIKRKVDVRITDNVVNAILSSKRVEQQSYRNCMGILKLAEKYFAQWQQDAGEQCNARRK